MSMTPSSASLTATTVEHTSSTSMDVENKAPDVYKSFSLPERQQKAVELKEAGNRHFVQGDYSQAKVMYTQAIAFDANVPALFSNRAACELKLEQNGLAIEDASMYDIDHTNISSQGH